MKTIKLADEGHNIAIHCSVGIGRTGLFSACLTKKVLGLIGERAISLIRQHIPGAVETPEQEQFVIDFNK